MKDRFLDALMYAGVVLVVVLPIASALFYFYGENPPVTITLLVCWLTVLATFSFFWYKAKRRRLAWEKEWIEHRQRDGLERKHAEYERVSPSEWKPEWNQRGTAADWLRGEDRVLKADDVVYRWNKNRPLRGGYAIERNDKIVASKTVWLS